MNPGKTVLFLVAGGLFGTGLAISGMTDPGRVIGFLDVFGSWDPALLFVMAGAVMVYGSGMLVLRRMNGKPRTSPAEEIGDQWFKLPPREAVSIDGRLVIGAAIFGVGWGLGGFCPGPALANLGPLRVEALVFVPTMAIGMLLVQTLLKADRCPGGTAQQCGNM